MKQLKLCTICSLLLAPSVAFGHAEEPSSESQITINDTSITKANFGLTSSGFEGMVCEEAFVGGDSWRLAALGETEWVVLGENNIQRTTDGCDFEVVKSTSGVIIPDVQVSPSRTTIVYIANAGEEEGVWISKDRGQTFEKAPLDTTPFQLTAVRFTTDDTFYVSGYTPDNDGAGFIKSFSVSDLSHSDLSIPDVKFPYLLDANANGLVWLGRAETLSVYWGTEAETDLRNYVPRSWPTGAVIAADGGTVWVGGVESGLAVAKGAEDGTWTLLYEDQIVSCLDASQDDLFICGLERRDGADIYRVVDDQTVEPIVQFTELRGARTDCPDSSDVGTVCPLVWKEIASYFGQEVPGEDVGGSQDMGPDSGSSDTGNPDVGGNDLSGDTGTSGCSAASPASTPSPLLLLLFGFAGRRLRRSRKRTN